MRSSVECLRSVRVGRRDALPGLADRIAAPLGLTQRHSHSTCFTQMLTQAFTSLHKVWASTFPRNKEARTGITPLAVPPRLPRASSAAPNAGSPRGPSEAAHGRPGRLPGLTAPRGRHRRPGPPAPPCAPCVAGPGAGRSRRRREPGKAARGSGRGRREESPPPPDAARRRRGPPAPPAAHLSGQEGGGGGAGGRAARSPAAARRAAARRARPWRRAPSGAGSRPAARPERPAAGGDSGRPPPPGRGLRQRAAFPSAPGAAPRPTRCPLAPRCPPSTSGTRRTWVPRRAGRPPCLRLRGAAACPRLGSLRAGLLARIVRPGRAALPLYVLSAARRPARTRAVGLGAPPGAAFCPACLQPGLPAPCGLLRRCVLVRLPAGRTALCLVCTLEMGSCFPVAVFLPLVCFVFYRCSRPRYVPSWLFGSSFVFRSNIFALFLCSARAWCSWSVVLFSIVVTFPWKITRLLSW